MNHIPFVLTSSRLFASLFFVFSTDSILLSIVLAIALLTDIFDGIIARRLGIATAALRRYDSFADTVFYLSVLYATWKLFPSAIEDNFIFILSIVFLEAFRTAFDFLKFGKEASYHFYSAKCWGISLFIGFFALFGFHNESLIKYSALIGIIPQIEGLIASFISPVWIHDVPSVYHVYQLKKNRTS